jgi:hypothetical protein
MLRRGRRWRRRRGRRRRRRRRARRRRRRRGRRLPRCRAGRSAWRRCTARCRSRRASGIGAARRRTGVGRAGRARRLLQGGDGEAACETRARHARSRRRRQAGASHPARQPAAGARRRGRELLALHLLSAGRAALDVAVDAAAADATQAAALTNVSLAWGALCRTVARSCRRSIRSSRPTPSPAPFLPTTWTVCGWDGPRCGRARCCGQVVDSNGAVSLLTYVAPADWTESAAAPLPARGSGGGGAARAVRTRWRIRRWTAYPRLRPTYARCKAAAPSWRWRRSPASAPRRRGV